MSVSVGSPTVEFVPEQHTDFIFQFEVTSWPVFLAAIGAAALGLALIVHQRRRRRHDEP
jgi:LPXTG-motif cell wall-anchored protein